MKAILYTSLGCHLCENAKELLEPELDRLGIALHEVEIADDDALLRCYGTRIPVVGVESGEAELDWPFDREKLREYLAQQETR